MLMDCDACPSYRFRRARIGADPDRCYPREEYCSDGDFGNEYLCKRLLGRIADEAEDQTR
jgi:hypothetical protein